MLKEIVHTGITVSDIERSVEFYKDVLGLEYLGELVMEGEATDRLFGRKNARARVAYLKGTDDPASPAVELIQFTDTGIEEDKADLFKTSVSEICFRVDDIDETCRQLKAKGVELLSEPEEFDFSEYGFGKSKAVYFRDPDGIILELTQVL